jgi:hypothetical protein
MCRERSQTQPVTQVPSGVQARPERLVSSEFAHDAPSTSTTNDRTPPSERERREAVDLGAIANSRSLRVRTTSKRLERKSR